MLFHFARTLQQRRNSLNNLSEIEVVDCELAVNCALVLMTSSLVWRVPLGVCRLTSYRAGAGVRAAVAPHEQSARLAGELGQRP